MKIVLIIVSAVVGLLVLSFGLFFWAAGRRHGEVGDVAHSLQRDFPAGTAISGLPDRALNLAASEITLSSAGEKPEILAVADRGVSTASFETEYAALKSRLSETKAGAVIVAFPVYMTARWVLDVSFADGKVTETTTRYLD